MATAPTPTPAPPPATGLRAVWRRLRTHRLLLAGAVLAGVLALGLWQAGRESSLQALARQAVQASGASLALDGVHGSLFGPLRLAHVRYRTPERELEATTVTLDWAPARLLRGELAVTRLEVDTLSIRRLAPSNEPATLPDSLALPYRLQLALGAAHIAHLELAAGAVQTRIDDIGFALEGDATRWRLRDARAHTPWGTASAALTLGAQRPFQLDGTAELVQADASLTVRAAGTLALPDLQASARGHGGQARAHLALAPFAPNLLRTLQLDADGLDPARWQAGWPHAMLTLNAAATLTPDGRVSGQLALHNSAPDGPLDAQRLPLRAVTATLGGTLDALALQGVLLDLGAAGRFDGSGTLGDNGAQAALRLHTNQLDLKALDGALRTTHIAGDLTLGRARGAYAFGARLAQDDLQLDAQAALDSTRLRLSEAQLRVRGGSVRLSGALELAGHGGFSAAGRAEHFNPARFGAWPAADLNADFQLDGRADADWRVAGAFTLRPSQLAGRALAGHASVQADRTHLHGLEARLALGGNTLAASGSFGAPGDRLDWKLDAHELAALGAGLAGSVSASGVLRGTYAAPASTLALDARGVRRDGNGDAAGTLRASGDVALRAGALELRLQGQAGQFDPAVLGAAGALPAGRLNADFSASGVRSAAGHYRGAFDVTLRPSTLAGAPLKGHAKAQLDGWRIAAADIDLQLAENRVNAHGRFGAPGDTLAWTLDAPRLAAFGPHFGGALSGNGTLSGTLEAPAASATLNGAKLTLLGVHSIATLNARLRTTPAQQGALEFHLALQDYRAPQPVLQSLTLDLSGTREAHTLRFDGVGPNFDLGGALQGRWRDDEWRGQLQALQGRGANPFALLAPAPLRLHLERAQSGAGRLDRFALGPASFSIGSGRLEIGALEKDGAQWKTAGSARAVPLAFLTQWSPLLRENAAGDLSVGANWDFTLGSALDGALRVFREKGDVTVGADTPLALGLSTLEARLNASHNALHAQLDMAGARAGTLHFDGATQLVRQDGRWRVAGDSPLSLSGKADMPSIAWLAPLTGQLGLALGGRLTLAMSGAGSFNAPQLNGQLQGDQLTVNWANEGVKLRNGQLRAQLSGQQVLLQTLRFDGPQGSAHAEGSLHFGAGAASMQLKAGADHLELLSRPDRVLVVSGQGSATLADKSLQLEGKFRAERAAIELAGPSGPTQSDDIVVVRGANKAAPPAPSAIRVTMDLEADLGEQFHLKGKGLDAELGGTVHVRSQERTIARATGTIRVIEGSYLAYGQRLRIERGVLTFNGPLDNPALNILAVRNTDENTINAAAPSDTNVQAGVEVRGTALAPVAKLVSTPNVADSEKLSWLVLGHGTEAVGSQEMDLLGAAAGALLGSSQASSLQSRLAGRLGLDTIAMGRAKGLETTVLTVGKRISQRAYLSFERGASSASNLVKLHYALNKRLSLQAQTGATTAFDILYSWAFD